MSEDCDPVLEAIAALRTDGHTVEPLNTVPPVTLVDREALTDWELVALAIELGLMGDAGRL